MAPAKRTPKPTAAELDLLRTLWRLGPATVKQVHEAQQRERPDLTYATVLRLMQVMHGKGLLKRDESQRAHVYAAAQQPGSMQNKLLDDFIHKAFSGSGKDLVLANREFDLLRFLMERSGQVIGRDEILTEVWGSADLRSSKTLDMHISWLRRKIGDDRRDRPRHIVTVRGVGFRFDP